MLSTIFTHGKALNFFGGDIVSQSLHYQFGDFQDDPVEQSISEYLQARTSVCGHWSIGTDCFIVEVQNWLIHECSKLSI